jgi:hypothetical protein
MNNNFIYLILVFYAITNIILARSENIFLPIGDFCKGSFEKICLKLYSKQKFNKKWIKLN